MKIKKNIIFLNHIIKSLWVRILTYLMPSECYVQQIPDRLLGENLSEFKKSYKKNDRLIGWTLSDPNRMAMFYLLLDNIKDLKGDFAEVGTHQGHTARVIFENKEDDQKLFIFDTFEGFDIKDVKVEEKIGVITSAGHFSNTSIEVVNKEITGNKDGAPSLITRKGYFPKTFYDLENEKFKFVHLDADLYNPMKAGLDLFYPQLVKGGYLLIHDYGGGYEGTRKAVHEFMENKEITLIPMYDKVGSALIIKH